MRGSVYYTSHPGPQRLTIGLEYTDVEAIAQIHPEKRTYIINMYSSKRPATLFLCAPIQNSSNRLSNDIWKTNQ